MNAPQTTDRHTLGPWIADRDDSREEYVIGTREGVPIGIREVATVQFGFDEPADSQQHANARLIAAAPDLRKVLAAMVQAHENLLSNTEGRYPEPDCGCIECTVGTVPNNLDTGLCAYHRAEELLSRV